MTLRAFVVLGIYIALGSAAFADESCITAEKVCWIDPQWDPENGVSPTCQKNVARGRVSTRNFVQTFVVPLQDAVSLAPSQTFADLCSVNRYFIVPGGRAEGRSWGLWENPDNPDYSNSSTAGSAYIAVAEEIFYAKRRNQ
jgi:hypothetical protein